MFINIYTPKSLLSKCLSLKSDIQEHNLYTYQQTLLQTGTQKPELKKIVIKNCSIYPKGTQKE